MLALLFIGLAEPGLLGLASVVALLCAFLVLRADLRRRRLPVRPAAMFVVALFAGMLGAKIFSVLETRAGQSTHSATNLLGLTDLAWFAGLLTSLLASWFLARHYNAPVVNFLDGMCPAAALASLAYAVWTHWTPASNSLSVAPFIEFAAWSGIAYYLWLEGRRTVQFQRPPGVVLGEFLVLTGAARFVAQLYRGAPSSLFGLMSPAQALSLACVVAGGALLAGIVPRFVRGKEEHRIIQHVATWGEAVQAEYHVPTPECPHPERWRMFDSMTAEVEVLDFLKCLITTVKPALVVETGTFMGLSTLRIAEGLKRNGFGRVVTCECDPVVFARARQRIDASGLAEWIECRNESSLETKIEGMIDLLFCDSDIPIREQEVRHFLPQVSPHGLILIHDVSSQARIVREAALEMEREGLLSVVLLPTPRGLVLAEKRKGRK